jgi:hypothetical protein
MTGVTRSMKLLQRTIEHVLDHNKYPHIIEIRIMLTLHKLVSDKSMLKYLANASLISLTLSFTAFTYDPPQKRAASDKTEVKAVFLFNFAQFVEWPEEVLPKDSTIVIGILGRDPFGAYLDETVRDEVVNGHPLKVERYPTLDRVQNCHILFISASRSVRVDNVLKKVKGKPILTVSDATTFARQGGMIRFTNDHDKVKLTVNVKVARESNLSISSKLLSLSEIIE